MAKAFGQGFPGDQELRARLARPLDTSQSQTPRISVSAEHQAYPGSRITSDHPSSQSRSVPSNHMLSSNIQQFPLPAQDQSPLQQVVGHLPTHSPPMYFNDYLKLHNQLAIPLPSPTANDSIYASSHGVIPNSSAPGRSTSAYQRHSHTHTWTYTPSSHQSDPTTSMALDDNTADNWPYHRASFPNELPGERGPHGGQGVAHGSGLYIHRNYNPPQRPVESSSTASSHKYQTWEELAHELGFHNR